MNLTLRRWLLVFFCWVALVAGLGFVKFGQISAAIAFGESFPEPSETVVTAVAEAAQYAPTAKVVGQVVPVRTVTLRNPLAGAIVEVGFTAGAQVAKGQLLIQQDISEERAQLAGANAQESLAQRTLARNEDLIDGNAISRQAMDNALAQRDAARAEAQRIRAIIVKKQLRAPFTGRVGLERWEAGGYLAAGTEITTLFGLSDDVWVDFSLPQRHGNIALNTEVTIIDDSVGELPAVVIARAPGVDVGSRSLALRASVNSPQLANLPGAIVTVAVVVGEPRQALVIPARAVREDTFGVHVFTLKDAEAGADAAYRASRRAVKLFGVVANQAFVAEGLSQGETIAATGAFKLRDELLVNVAQPSTQD
ncbi:MAG: efflux RND transporter periplasmic adaptor subunit [Lysobacterales bacterium]